MAVRVCVSPGLSVSVVSLSDTPVTGIVLATTDTLQVAVYPPSSVFTVITASPTALAVTKPLPSTEAKFELLLVHETTLFKAFSGVMLTSNCLVLPWVISIDTGLSVTPLTLMASNSATKSCAAVMLSSCSDVSVPTTLPFSSHFTNQ